MERFEKIVSQRRPLQRGDSLYRVGDRFHSLFAVRSGALKTIMITPDGDEQIIGFHMPGELLGFDGLSDYYNCNAVALERTSVCDLPLNRVEELSRVIAGLHRQLCSIMGRELNTDQAMLLLLAKLSADDRLAAFLLSLSKRFAQRGFSESRFILAMSRHDIANYLGLAPETVSRVFARFQQDGLLSVNRREIEIHDMDTLRSRVRKRTNSMSNAR
jgi:CRP/FNR family transcriptional regulator